MLDLVHACVLLVCLLCAGVRSLLMHCMFMIMLAKNILPSNKIVTIIESHCWSRPTHNIRLSKSYHNDYCVVTIIIITVSPDWDYHPYLFFLN